MPEDFLTKVLEGLFNLLSYLPARWGWNQVIYSMVYAVMAVLFVMILREYRW